MTDQTPDPPVSELRKLLADLLGRMKTLEEHVAAIRAERGSPASLIPYTPPTEEELHDMLRGPRGQSLLEIIEEYERQPGG